MRFGPVPLADAEGAVLAHSLMVEGRRLPKGRVLGAEDLEAAARAGHTHLTVARLEPGDVREDEAAARLAAAFAGPGLRPARAVHGRANLVALASGVLTLDPAAVDGVNAVDEALTFATLPLHARVSAGDVVATAKTITYALPGAALERALAAARPLALHAFRPFAIELIQTELPGQPDKLFAKMRAVTGARIAAMGATLAADRRCAHEPAALAGLLARPLGELTLVAGASATTDREDVIPAAIVAAGGRVERLGMPVDPGNLLCLGWIGARAVVGLPGCARSPKRNGVDWVIERLVAGLPAGSRDIAAMGVGGLLAEAERAAAPEPAGPVGAVVLAAGRSTRMGATNKLTAEIRGKPMVAHVVDAAAAAGLPPPVVVLGHEAERVRLALGGRAATFVTAPDHADGLSRSLAAGLAAVPPEWEGAIICLGDMPGIRADTLRALAQAFEPPGGAVVPTHEGKRGNPVLWGRAHFARLMAIAGDVGGKALLSELEGMVKEVNAGPEVLADIDTEPALAQARAGGGLSRHFSLDLST